jgi:hypothetical protein
VVHQQIPGSIISCSGYRQLAVTTLPLACAARAMCKVVRDGDDCRKGSTKVMEGINEVVDCDRVSRATVEVGSDGASLRLRLRMRMRMRAGKSGEIWSTE